MSQTPLNFRSRLDRLYQSLIEPHPNIKNIEDLRKAELLSTITIIITSFLFIALFFVPRNIEVFIVLICITLSSYFFSRTSNYQLGSYLFTYAFSALAYINIYRGTATSIDITIATIVHLALIFSSVLLPQSGFLLLILITTLATFTAPMYSTISTLEANSVARSGGIALTIGLVLYGINNFRAKLEKEQLAKITNTNLKLEEVTANQEIRIQERTQELRNAGEQLQQRTSRLQAISDISKEIVANISNQPDEVLEKITQTISQKLDYYHVGIFLLDKDGEYAVLRAANSRGGQRMLTHRHQLKVGTTGIVGYVTQSGRPRIALDTSADIVFFNNPDLPETRSEIALPLKYGETILGALDVQSTQPSAFTNEDVETLSALANQVSIVIRNLQIIEENKYSALNRSASLTRRDFDSGYSYQPDGSVSATKLTLDDPILRKVTASGETIILSPTPKRQQATLAVPVKFRDHIVGVIHVEVQDEKKKWSEDEVAFVQAISDRAAMAIENARLLEDSQRRASKEQAIGEISTKISANTDIEAILRTAVRELGAQISGTQITVEIGSGTNGNNNHTA